MCDIDVFILKKNGEFKSARSLDILIPEELPDSMVWVDIEGVDDEVFSSISTLFGLHELTIEDCLTPGHSPKLEEFDNYTFLLLRALILPGTEDEDEDDAFSIQLSEEDEEKVTRAVSLIFSDNFVITHRIKAVPWLDAVIRKVKQSPRAIMGSGPLALTHRVIDVLTDRFLRGLNYFERVIDEAEDVVFSDPESFELGPILEEKRTLAMLRQSMRDQAAVVKRFAYDPTFIVDDQWRRYFRDIDDHCKSIIKTLEKQIDSITAIRDGYFAMANIRLADIMRVLAVITVIALPLNLVVGLYGMNFQFIPLLHNPRGFWFVVCIMLFLTLMLLFFFRKKKWL